MNSPTVALETYVEIQPWTNPFQLLNEKTTTTPNELIGIRRGTAARADAPSSRTHEQNAGMNLRFFYLQLADPYQERLACFVELANLAPLR
jgi:hypothetical protein